MMNCRMHAARIWAQARTARLHRWRREQVASLCATASPWTARLEAAKGIRSTPSETSAVQQLSHIDGMLPGMVDVTDKVPGKRQAIAEAFVELPKSVREVLASRNGDDTDDIATLKRAQGPVFATAVIAGTQAAKQTASLIPLCHNLPVTGCRIDCSLSDDLERVRIEADVRTHYGTGVEMEALTAASVAGLTVIDMLKAWSPELELNGVRLLRKTGGKRDFEAHSTATA